MLAAARQASALLAVSEALKHDMTALGMPEDRIAVHYTGVDHQRFSPTHRESARDRVAEEPSLAIPRDGTLLVSTGALIERKGQRYAIEALTGLADARLALAGSGADESELRNLAASLGLSERVHFLGSVGHDLMPVLLSAASAMVLPSASEGLANAWVEALACGTPLVIPDVGGAREVMKDDSAGRIAGRDAGEIAAAVRDLLADSPDRAAVATNAATFSWEANAERLVEIWRAACAA
jgi:glycosyltransferase involved in cell wall biosynthesis